ncbi:glycosyltransferase family 2 protein [Aeoliella mucimassa]|uniref:Undecaprenyl-phosphate 4-deoxy-4-formamido-L-arabinose transferase n=1 Tax=Aeoliella mucimassa TaxID=2527972 RepID=A0A518AVD4_9BACT|nr:glycosyltransferase family 2 protein [Aeoliella mucimassa]QDU58673.1 Undecaprenyl-phosphate 4-deoxy-4-formamido-L-arabinose transferase [Aeoliella mucimassa]
MVESSQDTDTKVRSDLPGSSTDNQQREALTNETTKRMLSTLEVAEAGLEALEQHDEAAAREHDAASRRRTALKVSVLIPVYNEEETIRTIVDRVLATGVANEVVIVDDASTDGTRDVLVELGQRSNVQVLLHGYNKGKGAALHTALAHARGDIVLIQDADLEYDPTDYEKLIAPIRSGEADVVYGSRFLENAEQDPSWLHRFGNAALTWLSNATTGLRLTDMETCYKVFRKAAVRNMVLRETRFGFEPELTAKLARRKCRFLEVPIAYKSRGYDEGKKIHVRDGLRAIYCILRYWLLD